jgi:hypothetical protein
VGRGSVSTEAGNFTEVLCFHVRRSVTGKEARRVSALEKVQLGCTEERESLSEISYRYALRHI